MHSIDIGIVAAYMLLVVFVGGWVAKKASKNAESYFLAGKSLPWWLIGIAHGSSGFDITGTMWFVTMLFVYGVKASWLLWIWPLFNVVFRMMYLGVWVRRSNVMTGAEWMRTRFGGGLGSELAYLSVVVYALVSVVGFLSYAFQGIGKFTKPFFPWDFAPNTYGVVVMGVAGIYCVVGGMYSVVMNDVIQLCLKLPAAIIVACVAIYATSSDHLMAMVPKGWDNLFFGWKLDLDWSNLIPQLNDKLYGPIGKGGDGYALFMFFVAALFVKGVFVSMAGPTPNYAIQHVLSTRSPREAALENMVMALVSLLPRFLLITAVAVLGIVFFSPELAKMGTKVDFERILPEVVHRFLPVGCKGLLICGLLAAFMSTFVSTANSGVAYIVNDVYKRYINPQAPGRKLVLLGYLWSAIVIVIGIAFGYATNSVHSVTEWIVSALVPAYVAPNVLKWHWWRFNGWGFFAGMVAGTGAAVLKTIVPIHPIFAFFLIMAISLVASLVACLLTAPEDDALLMDFYSKVRPWGWWGPISAKCLARSPGFQKNRDFWWDVFNVTVGLVWQTTMVTFPIYLVIQQWGRMWLSLAIFAVTSLILKFTWYDRLGRGDMYMTADR